MVKRNRGYETVSRPLDLIDYEPARAFLAFCGGNLEEISRRIEATQSITDAAYSSPTAGLPPAIAKSSFIEGGLGPTRLILFDRCMTYSV